MEKNKPSSSPSLWRRTLAPSLSLLTSLSTLVCCALPVLFVTLGMGGVLVGLVSSLPWLIVLSEHKVYVFGFSGMMLLISAIVQYRARNAPCPIDPRKAKACGQIRKVSWFILGVAAFVYMIGFFFAFIAVFIFY